MVGNHVIEFKDAPDASVPPVDITGVFIDAAAAGLGSIPEFKWVFNANWRRNNWMANARVNYVDGLDEAFGLSDPIFVENKMSSWTTLDLQGGYTMPIPFDGEARLTFGIENVLNEQPPTSITGFNDNMDPRTHNLIGRFFYGRIGLSF